MTDGRSEEVGYLRREIRKLRILVLILLVATSVSMVISAATLVRSIGSRDLTVKSLSVQDQEGRKRALLAVNDGEPSLNFINAEGHVLVTAGITPQHQPHVGMLSDSGALKVALGTAEDGSPTVALFGAKGRLLAGLGVTGADQPILMVRSAISKAQATLGAHPGDKFALQISDPEGRVVGSHVSVLAQ
ncbi:MAG: hypothetical protein U0X73_08530 [Thermoanaerobaculia bacterium]